MAAMDSFLITVDGSEPEVSTGTVRHLLDTSARFWLDLAGLDNSTADGLLADTFGFHPLAVQDAEHFGQRPKLDPYDHFTLMVVYGATSSGRLVEVHCFYTENYLVTVHRDACPELNDLATRLKRRAGPRPDHVMLLYRVVDTLIDGYFRDLYDHLIRISDLVDSYRDLMSGVLDTHLSTVSNRLNVVMKQLTIIATIFLPLSVLTGFFGQNFAWMVTRITGLPSWPRASPCPRPSRSPWSSCSWR
jgi:Mg2+ and Co2+ transporter CorA